MKVLQEKPAYPMRWFIIFGFLFCVGIGRLWSFVLHDPLLAYANSYDMIRIQACHQIWPADEGIDITVGTPEAPLRFYTLDKRVETSCFPSSELLFTSLGIELAKIRSDFTGDVRVSMKTIAFVKAMALTITALLFGFYFFRRRSGYAFCLNALCMLVVLTDPATTLYLGTFYTEFSAVYFLYVLLAGAAVMVIGQYRWRVIWPLLLGLLGLGLSKPQHIPLVLTVGALLAAYLVICARRYSLAVVLLLMASLPAGLLATGNFTPRDEKMVTANKLNLVSSLLTVSHNPQQTLEALQLPEDCKNIAGKSSTDFALGLVPLCPAFEHLSYMAIANGALHRPKNYEALVYKALPITKEWIVKVYGHVEGGKMRFINSEHRTLTQWFPLISERLFIAVFIGVGVLVLALLCANARMLFLPQGRCLFALLLVLVMWAVFLIALFGDGLFDIGKHTHLLMPMLIMAIFSLVCMPLQLSRSERDLNAL